MCGIYGIFGEENRSLIEQMSSSMHRRGPDSRGYHVDEAISFGMNRLHIWGEGSDILPFQIQDNYYSYNGEVYGCFNENGTYLDNTAGGKGEVNFMAENKYSPLLDGMYALAQYDSFNKELTLFRDKQGIKPIFYYSQGDKVVFGSCIRTLAKQVASSFHFNPVSLFEIFAFGYPLLEQTAYESLLELSPGTSICINKSGIKENKLVLQEGLSVESNYQTLRSNIKRSIKNCQKGIEGIGLAISGGVDSTILAYELNEMGVEDLHTFSVVLAESGDGIRDLKELQLTAGGAWTRWKHHYVEIDVNNFVTHLHQSLDHFLYPTDMHSIPLYNALAKLVADAGIKVLLTGEGVDEYFMGYEKYRTYQGPQTLTDYYLNTLKGQFIKEIFDSVILKKGVEQAENFSDGDFWSKVRQMELRCRLQKLLHRTDVILMEHSIEGRTPFLHGGIPDIALSICPTRHMGTCGKEMIRSIYQDLIPGIAQKTKKRFKASENLFFDVFNTHSVKEILYSHVEIEGLTLDASVIDKIYKGYHKEKTDLSELLYLILTTKHAYKTLKTLNYETV